MANLFVDLDRASGAGTRDNPYGHSDWQAAVLAGDNVFLRGSHDYGAVNLILNDRIFYMYSWDDQIDLDDPQAWYLNEYTDGGIANTPWRIRANRIDYRRADLFDGILFCDADYIYINRAQHCYFNLNSNTYITFRVYPPVRCTFNLLSGAYAVLDRGGEYSTVISVSENALRNGSAISVNNIYTNRANEADFTDGSYTNITDITYEFSNNDAPDFDENTYHLFSLGAPDGYVPLWAALRLLTASFTYSPEYGAFPLEVDFTDTSGYVPNTPNLNAYHITNWEWDFGDGNISTDQNPTYTYDMPGEYEVTLTVTDSGGDTSTSSVTIYVYENDYSSGGRNVTKSTRIYRFGIPQEKKQGIGWSEYNGDDYPNAIGLVGTCKLFTVQDEERVIVTDCNSFKHYWLGREDHWVDGENEDYGGTQIESDILFRENVPSDSPTAKLRHSESSANLKPWFKDRRNTGSYGPHGFTNEFLASMYFRTESSPVDRAVVRYFRRRAQIVSDRHIEDESIQSGLRLVGAPWRLVDVEQWYQEIDTAAAPDEKQMSEKTWVELLSTTLIWVGRSVDLVNIDDGSHTMPWDKGSNQITTGSFTGVAQGPDGHDRSALAFGTTDSMSINESIPAGTLSIVLWVRSPVSPCTIMSNAILTIQLVQVDSEWELRWNDGTNDWIVPLTSQLTNWTMITIVRHSDVIDVYENDTISNTRYLSQNLSYASPIVFFGGQVIGFEPRVIGSVLTANAVRFIYTDVIENHGNTTCAMY